MMLLQTAYRDLYAITPEAMQAMIAPCKAELDGASDDAPDHPDYWLREPVLAMITCTRAWLDTFTPTDKPAAELTRVAALFETELGRPICQPWLITAAHLNQMKVSQAPLDPPEYLYHINISLTELRQAETGGRGIDRRALWSLMPREVFNADGRLLEAGKGSER